MTSKQESHTGVVKLSILSNNRAKHSDPKLAWIMFHKIAEIYSNLKHHKTLQAPLAIQNLKSPECSSSSPPYLCGGKRVE